MWLVKVFSVIYFTAFGAAQDSENVTSMLQIASTSPMPESATVSEPPTPTLQLKSTWSDVFLTEKVELKCSFNGGSDWTITWYRNGASIQETEQYVALSANKSELGFTAGKLSSGMYSCKLHHKTNHAIFRESNTIDVIVHGIDSPSPTVSKNPDFDNMFPGESVTFKCMVSVASGWEYVWHHNEKEVQASSSNTYTIGSVDHSNSGQYRCKARRGKDPFYTKESVISLQISDPPTPSLKLLSPWLDVFENERVEFSCQLDSSVWTFTWYKNNEVVQEDVNEDGSSLNMTSITRTHQGVYACKGHHKTRNVTSGLSNTANVIVYENKPTPTLKRNYGFNLMYVGETVNFTCTVDVASGWEYLWYRDNSQLSTTGKTITITLTPSDGGNYSCQATRGEETELSEGIVQNVLEIPVPSLTRSTSWRDVFPTESVKLSCAMEDGSDWTYAWYKDGQKLQADNSLSFESNGASLSISSASAKHTGQYTCKGHLQGRPVSSNYSSELKISVYDKKPSVILTQDPEYTEMFQGESVTFRCHVNVSSGWQYQWKKDDSLLNVSQKMYAINPIDITSGGVYECRAKRGSNQPFLTDYSQPKEFEVAEKPKPLITQQPNADKVYTGETVSFECKIDISSGWDYHWYKDGLKILSHSSRLDIHNATALKNGTYGCMATRTKTKYDTERSERVLHISQIPVPSLKQSTQWLDVFPTESVNLSCGMKIRSEWTYMWYKDGQEVHAGNTVSFDTDKTTLSIKSSSASHRGKYSCKGKFKSRDVISNFSPELRLRVYPTKSIVTLTQNPEQTLMHTGDPVSFNCHANISSEWEYMWFKDDTQLTESGTNYIISSVATKSSGSYKCQVKRGRSTVLLSDKSDALRLHVEERPQAEIMLLTGWSDVFSTDTLVLRCEVKESQDMWNYTWFKEGEVINLPPSEKHSVTPQDDPEQSVYTCQGYRTGRPSYSKLSDSFKTRNLLLKRRVLLSISGCIFFGIIAVFLGCIVLRVIRKPALDDDKLDEANLFLTMAQLKNRADAPCPLVDYVTEEALNAPAKEEDENGTICSETTPLPITTQEDQTVTTENHDTEENNGGLVSFKQ